MEAVRRPHSNTPSLFALSVASVISCSKMKGFEQEATEKTESVRQVFCVCLRIAEPSYIDGTGGSSIRTQRVLSCD